MRTLQASGEKTEEENFRERWRRGRELCGGDEENNEGSRSAGGKENLLVARSRGELSGDKKDESGRE